MNGTTDINAAAQQAAMSGNMSQTASREVSVMLSANTGAFQKEMQASAQAVDAITVALQKAESAYKKALKTMGGALIGGGVAMQAQATASAWSAASFEDQFARVAKTTGLENDWGQLAGALGLGGNYLQEFANDIRALSTEIPVGVAELAHLADVAGTLGVEAESLTLYADTAASLGAAINDLSSDQAIAGLANLMGAFGDAPETVTNLGSSLADLANKTRGSATDMLYFSDRLAGVAVQAGMTSEEVLGLGAAVSAIGVPPQLGSSSISRFIQTLSVAVQQGGEELAKFADAMGLTQEQLKELWNTQGGTAVLHKFLTELSKQGEAAAVTLQNVGFTGVETGQVLGGLAAQINVVNDALGISKDAWEEGTAVSELAAIRFDTVIKKLQQFRQSVGEFGRSMGIGFLEPMKLVIDMMTTVINVFNKIPQPIKTAIGFALGLGGALATLAGAYVLVTVRFGPFLAMLHLLQTMLGGLATGFARLSEAMRAIFATEAAESATWLSEKLLLLSRAIGMIPTVSKDAAKALGTQLVKAIRLLGNALQWAGGKMAAFLKWFTLGEFHIFNQMIGMMTKQVRSLGATMVKNMATALQPWMLMMGKWVGIAGLVGGALIGVQYLMDKFRNASDETALSMRELAEATGMAWQAIESFRDVEMDIDSRSFEEKARHIINQITRLREEFGDEAAQDYIQNYGLMLIESGNPPDEVQAQVEELARLADMPITFRYSFEEMSTGKGAAATFEDLTEGLTEVFNAQTQKIDNPLGFSNAPTKDFQAEFDSYMNMVMKRSEGNLAARLAAFKSIEDSLDQALENDLIERDVWENLNRQIKERELAPRVTDDANWFRRNLIRPVASGGANLVGQLWGAEGARKNIHDQGVLGFQEHLARAVEEPANQASEDWDNVRRIITDLTDETENFGQAILSLDDSQIRRVHQRLEEIAVAQEQISVRALQNATDLEKAMVSGQAGLDEDSAERYKKHLFETFQYQVGHLEALEQANTWLDRLRGGTEEWSEEADMLRNAIKTWGEEFAQMEIARLDEELNAMTAAEQVAHLNQELSRLQALGSFTGPVVTEIIGLRAQAMEQNIADFRASMGQYDALLDQREEAERAHGERLADLVEDRNKSIADLRESHAKRMEEINRAEAEALEDRVKQQADAFNATERLEAGQAQSAARLLSNIEAQNRAFTEARKGLDQLRSMGMGDDVIEALGLNDPRNVDQVQRLVQDAIANPSLIRQINNEWSQRLNLAEGFVESSGQADEIRQDFAEQREDAQRNLAESIQQVNENYADNVASANEAHAEQIQTIGERLDELGQVTAETTEELVDRAMKSGIAGLEEWAKEIEELQRRIGIADRLREEGPPRGVTREDIAAPTGSGFTLPASAFDEGWDQLGRGEDWDVAWERYGPRVEEEMTSAWSDAGDEAQKEAGKSTDNIIDEMVNRSEDRLEDVRNAGIELGTSFISGFDTQREEFKDKSEQWFEDLKTAQEDYEEWLKTQDFMNTPTLPNTPGGPDGRIPGAAMADGGLLPDKATIQRSGTLIQWAEPETGGEAFIPLAPGKRARSREIWLKTGQLLGMQTASYAKGGIRGSEPMGSSQTDIVKALTKALEASGPSGSHTTHYGPIEVKANDVNQLVKQLETRRRRSRLTGREHDV